MSGLDIFLIILIAAALVRALIVTVKNRKKCTCCDSCDGCCPHNSKKNTICNDRSCYK